MMYLPTPEPVSLDPSTDPYLALLLSREEYEDADLDDLETRYAALHARTAPLSPEPVARSKPVS